MNNAHMRTLWEQLNTPNAICSVHPLDVDNTINWSQVDRLGMGTFSAQKKSLGVNHPERDSDCMHRTYLDGMNSSE